MSYIRGEQADQALAIVRGYLPDGADPKLYRDHEGPFYNISWEGDPYEWAYDICEGRRAEFDALGVFAEPVANWCLGLYPAMLEVT